jgi:hypothetical protein
MSMTRESVIEKVSVLHYKKSFARVRNSLLPISNPSPCLPCPSSPVAREPVSVAISSDPLKKKEAMMPKANVSQGKLKMDKRVRRRELPYVRHSRKLFIEGESFVVRR